MYESVQLRLAGSGDAERIADLHADSWRRHYRGAYADSFLDGDLTGERRGVWSARLGSPGDSETVLAEQDGRLAGFVHVVFDEDPRWGSLVDNLHVVHDRQRGGIGRLLLRHAAGAVVDRAAGTVGGRAAGAVGGRVAWGAMYLWVLRQNEAAQRFYRSCGAICVETAAVTGDPARLRGAPLKLRMSWPDAAAVS